MRPRKMVPEVDGGAFSAFLVLLRLSDRHFFRAHGHALPFWRETHSSEFMEAHKATPSWRLMIHTFFDGIAIASGFFVSTGWDADFLCCLSAQVP